MGEEKLCERYIPVECQLQEVQRDYQRFFQSRDAVERYRQNDHQIQDENQLPRQLLLGVYQYDPQNNKKFKTYSAESVIANNGKSNTVALIKDPKLFCNATFFFVENLFADILDAVNDAEL